MKDKNLALVSGAKCECVVRGTEKYDRFTTCLYFSRYDEDGSPVWVDFKDDVGKLGQEGCYFQKDIEHYTVLHNPDLPNTEVKMNTKVAYYEWKTLDQRGSVDQEEPESVDGSLLVAEKNPIGIWEEDHTRYGCDYVTIFSAVYNGKKSWLRRADWQPGQGYCASGRQEDILSFQDGVNELLAHGCFEHLWQDDKREEKRYYLVEYTKDKIISLHTMNDFRDHDGNILDGHILHGEFCDQLCACRYMKCEMPEWSDKNFNQNEYSSDIYSIWEKQ